MPPTETEARLRRACAALDRRLRDGAACRAEELLAADLALGGDPNAAVELAYTEYATREELGQRPDPAEYLARFPAIRAALSDQFHVHALMRAELPPPPAADAPRTVGPYELLENISRGPGGRVFRARHRALGRVVALKLVPAAARGAGEAWAAARLEHPNVVRLYDVGADPAGAYLAMEYVGGGTLADRLAAHPLTAAAAAEVVEAVARAAHHAHTHGVVHRDIKPANVLLADPAGAKLQPKLADFGLATAGETGGTEGVVGTPGYMAPEQARGDSDVGPAADVYALGAVLYECLTGRPPFRADTPLHTLELVLTADPVPPRRLNPGVPRDLETVCLKCLHKSPARRYPTAAALADDLARWRAGRPVAARPVGPLERGWKWARRQPVVASLLGLLAVAAVALVAGGVWTNAQLRAAKDAAENEAETTRQAYEAARLNLYTAQLAQVNNLYQTDPGRALALLRDRVRCPRELRGFAWGLFHHHCRQDVRTFTVAKEVGKEVEMVQALTFSPDGTQLQAHLIRHDKTRAAPRAWVVATGEPCEPFTDDSRADPELNVTGNTVFLTRRKITLNLGSHPNPAAADATGRLVAVVTGNRRPRLAVWDADTGQELAAVPDSEDKDPPHVLAVRALAWSADGRWLASGGADRVVRVWEPAGLREVATLRGHTAAVRCLAFTPDGRFVASAADDLTVRVWPVDPPPPGVEHSVGNKAKITALAFTPDEAAVVVTTSTGQVKRWDLPFAGPPRQLADTGTNLLALAVAADGRVAAGGGGGMIHVLAPDGRPLVNKAAGHGSAVRGLAWSPDGRRLASASEDGVARVWADDLGPPVEVPNIKDAAMGVEFAADGRSLVVAGRGGVVLWNADTGESREVFKPFGDGLLFARFRPGGRELVIGGQSVDVKLQAPGDLEPVHTLTGHTMSVVGAAFTPDGRTLATGSGNRFENVPGEVKVWDVGTGHLRATLAGQTGPVAFSPDGWALATVEDHTAVRLWRADRP